MGATPYAGPSFDAVDIIRTKRDRGTLSADQIAWTIDAYTRGTIADEQMAALNMAILLNGMDRAEISQWTAAMIASGERMEFSGLRTPAGAAMATTDKHSTGGVGTRSPCPWPLWWRCLAWPSRSSRAAGWATRAARWTSWNPFRAGGPTSATRR